MDVVENKPKFVGIITAAILLSTFMSAVEGTVISTAMPTIIARYQVDELGVQYLYVDDCSCDANLR